MITVDPERDTVATIGPALQKIHPRFVGLTGSETALQAAYRAFNVERKVVFNYPDYGDVYAHGSYIYLLGADGRFLTLLPPVLGPERIAEVVKGYLDLARGRVDLERSLNSRRLPTVRPPFFKRSWMLALEEGCRGRSNVNTDHCRTLASVLPPNNSSTAPMTAASRPPPRMSRLSPKTPAMTAATPRPASTNGAASRSPYVTSSMSPEIWQPPHVQ